MIRCSLISVQLVRVLLVSLAWHVSLVFLNAFLRRERPPAPLWARWPIPAEPPSPGATVTIIGTETGSKRSAKTDDAGRFNFPQLKPGSYSRQGRGRGIRAADQRVGLLQAWDKNKRSTSRCKLAAAKGEVTVTGEAPLVNPENPNTSTTLNAPRAGEPSESRRRHDVSAAVRGGRLDEYRRQRQRFRRRHERLRQRAVQRLAGACERLHRRRPGNQRSAHESQQRPLDKSRAGPQFDRRSHREYALLHRRPGPLWSIASQLRHQVRHESVSRKPV